MDKLFKFIMLLGSVAGFSYGIVKTFKPKTALFKQLVVCAVGCFMLERFYEVTMYFTRNYIPLTFSVGMFGTIGGFMFIHSASFGQMDGLVDGKEKELSKYRLIAGAAPALIILIGVAGLFLADKKAEAITALVIDLFIGMASYYNLKHLIIPDVSLGIIDSIRGYSLVALVLCVATSLYKFCDVTDLKFPKYMVMLVIAACYLFIVPILERGSRKWTL